MPTDHISTAADAAALFASMPCHTRGRVRIDRRVRDALRMLDATVRVGRLFEARGTLSAASSGFAITPRISKPPPVRC